MTKYEEAMRAMRLGPIVATEAERVDLLREAVNEALEEAAEHLGALSVVATIHERKAAFADGATTVRALKKEDK